MLDSAPLHLVTAHYPPFAGGVADYCQQVAVGVAAARRQVHVWTAGDAPNESAQNPAIHRIGRVFDAAALGRLSEALDHSPAPRRLLVQYVPHMYGFKAMNVAFTRWVRRRGELGDRVEVMFHEVAYPFVKWPPHHNLLAAVNRRMAKHLTQQAAKVYISTESWRKLLEPLTPPQTPIIWLPVPSNVPACGDETAAAKLRDHLLPNSNGVLLGHFGTFGDAISRLLESILPAVLEALPKASCLLLGRGGGRWRTAFLRRHPQFADRLVATDGLEGHVLASHIAACDLMLQPYPDGVSTRRGTAMAALANGRAMLTNTGCLSETIWPNSNAILEATSLSPHDWASIATKALGDSGFREQVSRNASELYQTQFAITNTVEALLDREPAVMETALIIGGSETA